MKEGFEQIFSDIQTDMVSICLEYVEKKADKIYIYASYEAKTISCDFFYSVNGKIYKKSELPKGYDVNVDRQMSYSKTEKCADDMVEIWYQEICKSN